MARFRYRMQNILDISEKLESQAKIAYSLASQALLEEQEKLQQLIIRRAQYEMELKRLTSGDLDLREIQMTKNAINSMKSMIRVQMMNVQRAEHQHHQPCRGCSAGLHLRTERKDRQTGRGCQQNRLFGCHHAGKRRRRERACLKEFPVSMRHCRMERLHIWKRGSVSRMPPSPRRFHVLWSTMRLPTEPGILYISEWPSLSRTASMYARTIACAAL